MALPVGQIAPETLLDTFTTKFHTLSENFRKASAQVDKLKFDHHQLSAERDALTARVAPLQTQIQDASVRQAPRWNFFPSPAAFWNFRPNLAHCLLPNFGTPSCDWLSTQSRKLKARLPLRLLLNRRNTPHPWSPAQPLLQQPSPNHSRRRLRLQRPLALRQWTRNMTGMVPNLQLLPKIVIPPRLKPSWRRRSSILLISTTNDCAHRPH